QDESYDVLLPIKPRGSRPPLFCVHPGIGLSWCFTGLSTQMDLDQPLYGLQARGFTGSGKNEKMAATLEEMVLDYIDQVRSIQPHGPYHLLGYSFGGLVAHTMAAYLEKQGERVALVALMDTLPDLGRSKQYPSGEDEDDDVVKAVLSKGDTPLSADDWKPFVLGKIWVHDIECEHTRMDLPEATAIIGRVLRQKLNELHGQAQQEE
ncbi:hypothetical protein BGX28_006754, partial [Mortierella sp. GBA30]